MADWSFQETLIADVLEAMIRCDSVMMVSPTGSGKSRVMSEIIFNYLQRGKLVALYSHRKVIHKQLSDTMRACGFEVGVIASGKKMNLQANLQVAMIQTVHRSEYAWRSYLDKADLAIIDEAHCEKGKRARDVINRHLSQGCKVLGVTATPEDQADMYQCLVLGPSPKELRERGVLVPIHVYAPSEVDMAGIKVTQDYVGSEVEKRMKKLSHVVIGDIVKHWRKHNPYALPTVCFAPSVGGSKWLRDEFEKNGIPSAHIDASTTEDEREELFDRWRAREIKIITNFGILQEGFDFPGLHCCILAQPTRSMTKLLQIYGRVRRSAAHKEYAIILDHVGNWHRHPGAMDFHDWSLEENSKNRRERLKKKEDGDKTPREIVCVGCDLTYANEEGVMYCPGCGVHKHTTICKACGKQWVPSKDQTKCECGAGFVKFPRRVIDRKGVLRLVSSEQNDKEFDDDICMRKAIWIAAGRGANVITAFVIAKGMLGRKVDSKAFPWPKNRKDLAKPVVDYYKGVFEDAKRRKKTVGEREGHGAEGDLPEVRAATDEDAERSGMLAGCPW